MLAQLPTFGKVLVVCQYMDSNSRKERNTAYPQHSFSSCFHHLSFLMKLPRGEREKKRYTILPRNMLYSVVFTSYLTGCVSLMCML